MKAYAGGAKQSPSEPAPVTRSPLDRKQTATDEKSGGLEKHSGRPAVRKGFFGSSRAAGALYGDEGSREGEGGRKKKDHKADRDFERLVALADPDMGIGVQASLTWYGFFGYIFDNRFSPQAVFLRQTQSSYHARFDCYCGPLVTIVAVTSIFCWLRSDFYSNLGATVAALYLGCDSFAVGRVSTLSFVP